jgi:arabinogalactan endo-1,4-beta-galactosidase
MKYIIIVVAFFSLTSCSSQDLKPVDQNTNPEEQGGEATSNFYYGADLSYVNEMVDCGAKYKDNNGIEKNPFKIFKEAGTNMVRVRLWNNPTWTNYSNYEDVKKTISEAKAEGMKVLLDFHYSDTWADPNHQEITTAWLNEVDNTEVLGDSLYNYTYKTLNNLSKANLLPDMVQVGNEINAMILQHGELKATDWNRNSFLINKGIKAVRDISAEKSKKIEVMLHVAQPENGLWWFDKATKNGITDFDIIGLSYYPKWSTYKLDNVGTAFKTLTSTYKKPLIVVETAYPFTMEDADSAGNILGSDSLIDGYPATQQGQLDFLNKLAEILKSSGGEGLVYWEPAWISTPCETQWGQGSHWDNATLFDHNDKATLGMKFYNTSLQ